uniref:Flavin-containing monooxygenase n=1 Tax=Ananas comosus var. bracteatus TaxID=296719 RepID=A0A6V7Q577_ANACO|nr:unnamed protein product [Ananas comosus var. bracteatus]
MGKSGETRVAIVGGGISGLAAAKQLAWLKPTVFEATESIGGVWRHCAYRTTRLQTPRPDYEFSDHPWADRADPTFPTSTEILDYLDGYADRFQLRDFIKLNSKVVEIRYLGSPEKDAFAAQWAGTAQRHSPANLSGRSGWSPENRALFRVFDNIIHRDVHRKIRRSPEDAGFSVGRGPEIFQGKVMHTLDYCKLDEEATKELMRGKKVVILGYKKSAIDLAVECAEANQGPDGEPCTMVIRTLHWTVPSYSIWGLPFFLFYSTRLSQFLHERPNQGLLRSLLCLFLAHWRGVSKFIESYLTWKLPLEKYGLKPDHPFDEDYASCQMAILPENFFAEADRGLIRFEKSSRWCFWEKGVVLDDGTKLEADIVFLATGFDGKKKLRSVLPEPFRGLIEDSNGGHDPPSDSAHGVHRVHRERVEPPHVGATVQVAGEAAGGRFELPTVEGMVRQTNEETEVMKRTTRFYRRHCISTFSIDHSDEICAEMGWKPWRKGNWLSEIFSPYSNQDYKADKSD